MRQGLLWGCVLALSISAAHAKEYFVNERLSEASDENPGTSEKPFKTISRAAKAELQPGDRVLISTGTYRESIVIDKNGEAQKPISFEAAPGATVVVTGADLITGWKKEEGEPKVFSAPWPHQFMTHPNDDYHKLIGRCEQVFVSGYAMRQVDEKEKLTRGTFLADTKEKRLYVCSESGIDVTKVAVEASVRGLVWDVKGAWVTTRGIHFRYAANPAQHGAAKFSGAHDAIEDCIFEWTNASGAVFSAEDIEVRRCVFQYNGQLGFSANRAHRLHVDGCTVRQNNLKNFSRGWEAGGDKIVFSRGVILEKSQFIENRGNGVWFDIGNEDNTIRQCLIADNEDAGVFYEISYGLTVQDCVISGNGLRDSPGAWGAAGGICLSSSPGCIIERNLLIGNKEGFCFREQDRTTPKIDDPKGAADHWVWNHDQIIRNNVFAHNRDAQVWGWFDMKDGRHWPAGKGDNTVDTAAPKEDIAKDYLAKEKGGGPKGLTLELLKITFENNYYHTEPGQQLFHWGVAWKKNMNYPSLDAVRAELKLENGSQAGPLEFKDATSRDYRLAPDAPAIKLGCYPKEGAPGVLLGVK